MKTPSRFILVEDNGTYAVDVWENDGKYQAHAQQLYVNEYRVGHASQENTETLAAHKAVQNAISKNG